MLEHEGQLHLHRQSVEEDLPARFQKESVYPAVRRHKRVRGNRERVRRERGVHQ